MPAAQPQPRVDRLHYKLRCFGISVFRKITIDPDARNFLRDDGPLDPRVAQTPDFKVTLNEGRAEVEMLTDYSTIEDARSIVEPYLRAWEIESYLKHFAKHADTQFPIQFTFDGADISNPGPGTPVTAHVRAGGTFLLKAYPDPPQQIEASEDVRQMWLRWQECLAGRESLPSMAYYCLTVVEACVAGSGRRKRAAALNRIDVAVLNKLGDLVSEVGDERQRRKEHAKHHRPYTDAESVWIQQVTLALIKRLGEIAKRGTGTASSNSLPIITLADFPAI